MFEHQKKYEAFIREQGVGQNDKAADSCKSYVSYLNGVEKHANIRINSKTLASENDISAIVAKLHESHEISDRTIGNYVSAMRQYVNMVNQSAPHANKLLKSDSPRSAVLTPHTFVIMVVIFIVVLMWLTP
ncbi:site-specific integrase [Vibrio navarrensis]|uniref:site-specific integrase n=1 Tax=Vibrio navarrensis TaxID=29495 RepID=UPI0015593A7C|nr:site-specific integrase [Vibrio navarrensis]